MCVSERHTEDAARLSYAGACAPNSTLSLCIVGATVGVGAPHIWIHSVLLQSTAKMQHASHVDIPAKEPTVILRALGTLVDVWPTNICQLRYLLYSSGSHIAH